MKKIALFIFIMTGHIIAATNNLEPFDVEMTPRPPAPLEVFGTQPFTGGPFAEAPEDMFSDTRKPFEPDSFSDYTTVDLFPELEMGAFTFKNYTAKSCYELLTLHFPYQKSIIPAAYTALGCFESPEAAYNTLNKVISCISTEFCSELALVETLQCLGFLSAKNRDVFFSEAFLLIKYEDELCKLTTMQALLNQPFHEQIQFLKSFNSCSLDINEKKGKVSAESYKEHLLLPKPKGFLPQKRLHFRMTGNINILKEHFRPRDVYWKIAEPLLVKVIAQVAARHYENILAFIDDPRPATFY